MENQKIAILCSGVTLGVYNPALIVRNKLQAIGQSPLVFVCENLFYNDKRNKVSEMRKMFHRDFKFALMGQRISGTVHNNFDPNLVEGLFLKWQQGKIKKFIVFSGFWMSLLEEYFTKFPYDGHCVDIYHMDAVESESWKTVKFNFKNIQHIWFFNWYEKSINSFFDISGHPIIPYCRRNNRFIIHGGGWGIGTYKQKIEKLGSHGLKLDIINYEYRDVNSLNSVHRYFLIDPTWNPWEQDVKGDYLFPPFGQLLANNTIEYIRNNNYQEVYNIIRTNLAVISKPGGATIFDSLSSATPIVFLDPFGEYERKNAELMVNLGLGIWYDDWERSSFSTELLKECHNNLIAKRENLIEFTDLYKKNYFKNTNQYEYEY